MEEIYKPRYKHITNIEEKFNLYKHNLDHALHIPKTDKDIKIAMNFQGTPAMFDKLVDSISLDNLAQPDDIRATQFDPSVLVARKRSVVEVPKRALRLKTVSIFIESQGKYCESHKNRYLKYNKYKHIKINIDNTLADLQPMEEILLAVRIYEPFRYKSTAMITMKPKLSQEFLLLGSQYLSELRDKIHCQCQFGPFFDISSNPTSSSGTNTSFDHGFFFITDTFYNDTRKPTVDYSDVIREWAKKQKQIGELKTDAMEQTMLKDLIVRLGYPQLYQHHGNCEHLFTFSDIRLIAHGDSLKRQDYPILRMVTSTRHVFCMICGVAEANVIVTNSEVHIHDPSYLCTMCFESYHYIDGKKVGEFQAYRYFGNKNIWE